MVVSATAEVAIVEKVVSVENSVEILVVSVEAIVVVSTTKVSVDDREMSIVLSEGIKVVVVSSSVKVAVLVVEADKPSVVEVVAA